MTAIVVFSTGPGNFIKALKDKFPEMKFDKKFPLVTIRCRKKKNVRHTVMWDLAVCWEPNPPENSRAYTPEEKTRLAEAFEYASKGLAARTGEQIVRELIILRHSSGSLCHGSQEALIANHFSDVSCHRIERTYSRVGADPIFVALCNLAQAIGTGSFSSAAQKALAEFRGKGSGDLQAKINEDEDWNSFSTARNWAASLMGEEGIPETLRLIDSANGLASALEEGVREDVIKLMKSIQHHGGIWV